VLDCTSNQSIPYIVPGITIRDSLWEQPCTLELINSNESTYKSKFTGTNNFENEITNVESYLARGMIINVVEAAHLLHERRDARAPFSHYIPEFYENMRRMLDTDTMELEEQLAQKRAQLESAAEELREAILAKDEAVAAKDEAVDAKDEAVAEKDEAVAEKDEAVAEKDEAVAAKDDEIERRREERVGEWALIKELQTELMKSQEEIDRLLLEIDQQGNDSVDSEPEPEPETEPGHKNRPGFFGCCD